MCNVHGCNGGTSYNGNTFNPSLAWKNDDAADADEIHVQGVLCELNSMHELC